MRPLKSAVREPGATEGPRTNCRQLMEELFELCLDSGLVVMPAWVFALPTDPKYDDPENSIEDVSGCLSVCVEIFLLTWLVAHELLPYDLRWD